MNKGTTMLARQEVCVRDLQSCYQEFEKLRQKEHVCKVHACLTERECKHMDT